MEQIIWYIDENKRDLRTYEASLEEAIFEVIESSELSVQGILARPNLDDYVELLNDPRTVSFIIDQKMRSSGETDYNGIHLAAHLRKLDAKIPIYILTANAEDDETINELAGNRWTIEYVFEKDVLDPQTKDKKKLERKKELVQRLVRRIAIHQEVADTLGARFDELIRKSLSEVLTEAEQRELSNLEVDRTKSIIYAENQKLGSLRNTIAQLNEITQHISNLEQQIADHKEDKDEA